MECLLRNFNKSVSQKKCMFFISLALETVAQEMVTLKPNIFEIYIAVDRLLQTRQNLFLSLSILAEWNTTVNYKIH